MKVLIMQCIIVCKGTRYLKVLPSELIDRLLVLKWYTQLQVVPLPLGRVQHVRQVFAASDREEHREGRTDLLHPVGGCHSLAGTACSGSRPKRHMSR